MSPKFAATPVPMRCPGAIVTSNQVSQTQLFTIVHYSNELIPLAPSYPPSRSDRWYRPAHRTTTPGAQRTITRRGDCAADLALALALARAASHGQRRVGASAAGSRLPQRRGVESVPDVAPATYPDRARDSDSGRRIRDVA